jgi:hypothetical protein
LWPCGSHTDAPPLRPRLRRSRSRILGKAADSANLLRLAGACEDIDGSNPEARYGYQGYEPKDWYVSDRIAGLEGHAQQIGNVIAGGENARLYEAIAQARALRRIAGDINQRLDHPIEAMRQNGYKPTAIFVPWRVWELPPELDLQRLADPRDGADVVLGKLGRFRDLDVVEMRDLPADRVVLADLQAFATFRQRTDRVVLADLQAFATFRQRTRGADALAITVASFDEQTAKATASTTRQDKARRPRTGVAQAGISPGPGRIRAPGQRP